MKAVLPTVLLTAALLSVPVDVAPVFAQTPIGLERETQESRIRLERIREERAQLQREMEGLRSRVRDATGELENIERQLSASRSALREIELQIDVAHSRVARSTEELARIRDDLRRRQIVLDLRLRDIYKRGPLHTAEVLLGADSFSDLLNRYRYLHVIASYDRSLIRNVRALELELSRQNEELRSTLTELSGLRETRIGEVSLLQRVEALHQEALEQFQSLENRASSRMQDLEEDESRLADVVRELEGTRLEEERRTSLEGAPARPAASLTVADAGVLGWPVEGPIAYPFGLERRPDGTALRWNGLGIRAPVGTPVQAVRAGLVNLAGPFEGYGPSVILSHGDGFYTLYLYLAELAVSEGSHVEVGQVLGTVGGADTPEGPRLEFQLRAPVDGGIPRAIDPMTWLRPPGGNP
jgi:murein hydrolase activator